MIATGIVFIVRSGSVGEQNKLVDGLRTVHTDFVRMLTLHANYSQRREKIG